MRRWTVAEHETTCGVDFCRIAVGDPLQLIAIPGVHLMQRRCLLHAEGEVDWAAIKAAKRARADAVITRSPRANSRRKQS